MSLSKGLYLTTDSQKRQSFDERICDDLSELILQYLPLKDKLRLEGVSKQFQRTVFQREIRLTIYFRDLKTKFYESILKKCPNIRTIECKSPLVQFPDLWPIFGENLIHLFETIANYCHNLSTIDCRLFYNQKTWQLLHQSMDSNKLTITNIAYYARFHSNEIIIALNSLAFVRKLQLSSDHSLPLSLLIGLKNLNKVWIHFFTEEFEDLQTLVENNKSLEYLKITAKDCDLSESNDLIKEISKLSHLIELKIGFSNELDIKSLAESLKQMTQNCLKLKSISFEMNIYSIDSIMDLISCLKGFKSLKRLSILSNEYQLELDSNHTFSLEVFKDFNDLTHLTLEDIVLVNNSMLKDIEIFLPKLAHLKINPLLEMSDSTVDILSRIPNLQTIELNVRNRLIVGQIKGKLSESCGKLREIQITAPYFYDSDDNDDDYYQYYSLSSNESYDPHIGEGAIGYWDIL